jgi:hypothetical protein
MPDTSWMTSSESARLALYNRLEQVLGHENADTLMTSLPPQPGSELATKDDMSALRGDFHRLEGRFERLEDRFDRLEAKMDQHIRTYCVMTIGSMTGLTAIFGVIVTVFR